ncbi:DUF4071 domain-containing protein [Vibrio sp. HS-50-1]|uniref:DUF4071 domain-containing protein n=1 Tax=Vibrio sp. HS-50-1 TaxID=2945079 RepID=UPI00215EE220|nr:DUF4071 domain-containing protein [Vibrio sp. HS-50-1]MCS0206104.1 DUF4071 domain-containing protein [Vibrio sp. HS-50-1]
MTKSLGTQLCFVDMPFGKKVDEKSGIEIDFDQVYQEGIEPAIVAAGLTPIRGDREETGGIIHTAMFARLLLSDFVVADMTTANPNVFYELGVRHTAKPYTTIPIFATTSAPPFDVNMVRAIPYKLTDGSICTESAEELKEQLTRRIERVLAGPPVQDSPLFGLFKDFPGIEMKPEMAEVFRDRIEYSRKVKKDLAAARTQTSRSDALESIDEIIEQLGELRSLDRGIVIDIYLNYRAMSAWDKMIDLYNKMPADIKGMVFTRQQFALALNRRNEGRDREEAIQVIKGIIDDSGNSAESSGILGRIYKDKYKEAQEKSDVKAGGWLGMAIDSYKNGFELEPTDYYPGVNAITLLQAKGDEESLAEIKRLLPLVIFAAERQGGRNSNNYWIVATLLELACISHDYELGLEYLPRALVLGKESWQLETTANNLRFIQQQRFEDEKSDLLSQIIDELEGQMQSL